MLLSETELRAALEPLLDRLLAERLRLFQLQIESRMQALIATALQPQGVAELQSGLRRLQEARSPAECLDTVFELSAALVGPQRALLVVHKGQTAVWKREGLNLPERFASERAPALLGGGSQAEIRVRGRVVGLLYWTGAAVPRATEEKLDLLIRTAGLVMLESALPEKAAAIAAPAAEDEPKALAPGARNGETRAQRFASLLLEDLRLFLERERGTELAAGAREGDWRQRFAPEIERCRRAFRERFADKGDEETFEEVVPRVGERSRS
ncbi:MAG: hypothetical protein ACRD04_09190 [Terriglobales bacterium]